MELIEKKECSHTDVDKCLYLRIDSETTLPASKVHEAILARCKVRGLSRGRVTIVLSTTDSVESSELSIQLLRHRWVRSIVCRDVFQLGCFRRDHGFSQMYSRRWSVLVLQHPSPLHCLSSVRFFAYLIRRVALSLHASQCPVSVRSDFRPFPSRRPVGFVPAQKSIALCSCRPQYDPVSKGRRQSFVMGFVVVRVSFGQFSPGEGGIEGHSL